MKRLLFYQTRARRTRAYELMNMSKTATNKAELSLTFIQQPGVNWEQINLSSGRP